MTLQIALALYPLCLAGVALVWALRARPSTRWRWLVEIAASVSVGAFAFLGGPWAFTSYYLRYALLGLLALVVLRAYRSRRLGAGAHKDQSTGRLAFSAPVLLVFTVLNALAVASHFGPRESLAISFPLAAGAYYVLQGGNSVVTNPFHALSGSKLAVDIVRLNAFGNRARGIAPRALGDYEIFGDALRSPCAGTVLAVRNSAPDHAPGDADMEHPEGNYVMLKCGDVDILMGHLKQGSIEAVTGDAVLLGQRLGRVGNSGNTLEPHLHIEATKGRKEVGLIFDGWRPSLNSVIVRTRRAAQAFRYREKALAAQRVSLCRSRWSSGRAT